MTPECYARHFDNMDLGNLITANPSIESQEILYANLPYDK